MLPLWPLYTRTLTRDLGSPDDAAGDRSATTFVLGAGLCVVAVVMLALSRVEVGLFLTRHACGPRADAHLTIRPGCMLVGTIIHADGWSHPRLVHRYQASDHCTPLPAQSATGALAHNIHMHSIYIYSYVHIIYIHTFTRMCRMRGTGWCRTGATATRSCGRLSSCRARSSTSTAPSSSPEPCTRTRRRAPAFPPRTRCAHAPTRSPGTPSARARIH